MLQDGANAQAELGSFASAEVVASFEPDTDRLGPLAKRHRTSALARGSKSADAADRAVQPRGIRHQEHHGHQAEQTSWPRPDDFDETRSVVPILVLSAPLVARSCVIDGVA